MSARKFMLYFFLEILVTITVIALFRSIDDRRLAGLWAGGLFLGFGILFLWDLWRHGRAWRTLSFWLVMAHLGFTTIPMLVVRLWNWENGFHQVRVWGIPGPLFHVTAERVFAGLMMATLLDAIYQGWRRHLRG